MFSGGEIYKEWIEKNKIASQEEDDNVTQGKQPSQSQADRFMVLGTKRRKWHTKGMEKGADKGQKNKFKRELKRPEQIMKERRIQKRKQASQKSRQHVKAKRRFMKAQRTKKQSY
ncbi:hypothetical protein CHS0354_014485 [Potamilus streckersoni]|uniref:Uncharacterized protein n=1 Tax=Potamilus streckersoni TaxID=2493646 RepID=A0AAE0VRJ0_9BIVA|nr:hypothetical protein CHS0354_014485 [Potamilus streckersoni]